MCGICGYVSKNIEKDILLRMCAALMRRGPDESGFFIEEDKVGLAMQRLSIIDLDTGKQPISNEDDTVTIVFNGEIYNYLEIRTNLEKKGHKFKTLSDTEVIVHLYEDYGDYCVEHLNGMFAFALWDKKEEKLLLARDRMGKKPLHYAQFNDAFIFGSEIKAILQHPIAYRQMDLFSVTKYLLYEYVPAPNTLYSNIKKLLPGHMLIYKNGKVDIKRYWDVCLAEPGSCLLKEDECIDNIFILLRESIERRLRSDVPLGVFLSGGIDSSAIVAIMSEFLGGNNIHTFSIGFEDPSFDEIPYAREVAKYFETNHHEHTFSLKDAISIIPEVSEYVDEPLADASLLPTYLLSKFTRQHVKVALGGDGGDELFGGYPTLLAHKLVDIYTLLPKFGRSAIESVVRKLPVSLNNMSFDFKAKRFIKGIGYPHERQHAVWLGAFDYLELNDLLSSEFKKYLNESDVYIDVYKQLENCQADNTINRMLYLDMKMYLQDDILVKVDRASMANSLEVRAPFLDYKLVEFVASLPPEFKLHNFTSKYILKKTLEHILPKSILKRPKKGFGIPVAKWLREDLKDMMLDMLSSERLKRIGIFEPEHVRKLIRDHLTGKVDNRKPLWTLLMFELWREKWMEGSSKYLIKPEVVEVISKEETPE